MKPILVTGANGQLGRALLELAAARGVAAVGHDLDTLDITDWTAVASRVTELAPAAIVNCAAQTDVDGCEDDEEAAMAINGRAVVHLAKAADSAGALLVQISTDYVFGGALSRPLREDDPVAPLGVYGRSKLAGESAARAADRHLVVRTAWLYGRGGRNFVEAIRRQLDGGVERLRVVADQTGTPTSCDDLAAAVLDLLARDARGLVHAVNGGATTWHGFACEIVRLLGRSVAVDPVATSDYPRPAARPAYSVLDTSRLAALLGHPLPEWQDALARYLEAPSCEP